MVQILRSGVQLAVEVPIMYGEEEKVGVLAERDDVKKGTEKLMNEEEEGVERRKRAKELGESARWAMEEVVLLTST